MNSVTKWDLRLMDLPPSVCESGLRVSNSWLVVNPGSDCQRRDLLSSAAWARKEPATVSARHRKDGGPLTPEKIDEADLRPDKTVRAKEHRKVRHQLHMELHTVEDPEDAVFSRPKFDHPPRTAPKKKTKRHWKVKAWKRRTAERKQRNAERRRIRESGLAASEILESV
jgi:hypothetical protein